MQLTDEEVRRLAEVERLMDSGEVPYVIYHGQRAAMTDSVVAHFQLRNGQTVSDIIWDRLLAFKLSEVQAQIALQKAAE